MKIKQIILYAVIFLIIGAGCTAKRPEISEEALIGSAQLMEANQEIEDAEIIVEGNKIKFYLVPMEELDVPQERMRELGEDFLKFLGGYVANEELLGPSEDSYGQIFDYYDVEIVIEGHRTVLDKGTMTKASNQLIWQ